MQDIKELSSQGLKDIFKKWGEPEFRAQQIFSWVYKKGVQDFDGMSDLPLGLRRRLKDNFSLLSLKLAKVIESKDKTKKFLFALKDGNLIEAVIIPAEKRLTGCLSTQVGCKFGCRFCASGLLGFKRNLSCGEILDEVLSLKKYADDRKLTHLVFMGIGEPLDNYANVIKAIRIINSPEALNIAARRMTISTCGILPGLSRLASEGLQIELSVSLHAADDKTRSSLMPINKKYPLRDLIAACREYIEKTNRQITFEYLLIKDINSSLQSAKNLVKILKDLKLGKVNLIPCNIIRELKLGPPPKLEILWFKDCLLKSGINATLRRPRGTDIEAACGQLRLRYENK